MLSKWINSPILKCLFTLYSLEKIYLYVSDIKIGVKHIRENLAKTDLRLEMTALTKYLLFPSKFPIHTSLSTIIIKYHIIINVDSPTTNNLSANWPCRTRNTISPFQVFITQHTTYVTHRNTSLIQVFYYIIQLYIFIR